MDKQSRSFHGYLLRQAKPGSQGSSSYIISIEQFLNEGYRPLSTGLTSNDPLWNNGILQLEEAKTHFIPDSNPDDLWVLPEA